MKKMFAFFVSLLIGCGITSAQSKRACSDACCKKQQKQTISLSGKPLVCKLSGKELLEHKATIIARLKKEVLERKELSNGYSFKFKGDDESIDRLVSFVKSERQCCGFFTFRLSITEEYALLELTGPEGAKDFVTEEIGL